MNGKGWHNEPQRHSLAARGISTRARALVKPSGRLHEDQHVEKMVRVYTTIKDVGSTLRHGVIGRDAEGIIGGITTNPLPGWEFNFEVIGQIYVTLDPGIILDNNNLIKIEYTPEFFRENLDIAQRVGGGFIDEDVKRGEITEENMDELLWYETEEELVSRTPIVVPSQAVKKIEIYYAGSFYNPITGEDPPPGESIDDPKESYKLGKRIVEEIRREIPETFWDRVEIYNDATDDRQRLRWLI